MRSDIGPGAVCPDYEALVLVLARGGYCPKDRRQHEGLLQGRLWVAPNEGAPGATFFFSIPCGEA